MTRTTVLSRGGLVAVLLLLAFAFQGTRGIWEPDEGRYTAVALNMLESGNWLLPTVDGEHPHLTKPPLTYWALAGSFAAFGRNEWAARLPGALAFLGTGWLLFALGRRLCPAQPALPALVWALSPGPLIGANVVSTDALLVFFETAAMVAFVEARYRDGATRGRWILAMWLGWGLAFMTKGPPALLPLLAMLCFLAIHDRARLRGLFAPAGLAVFAAVGLTWFVLIVRQEPGRLGYFLGYEVYDRIFTGAHARNAHWYEAFGVYLPVLLVGALPWWPLALAAAGGPRGALAAVRLRARDPEWLLLAWWLLLPLAVFFLARSRLHLYVLPVFVPLALVLARILAGWAWLHPGRQRAVVAATLVALVALKGVVAYWPADRDARAMADEIERIIGPYGIAEIAFVDMRGFHGLQLYLGLNVETVRTGAVPPLAPSRFVVAEELCAEIAEHEDNVYAVKETRASSFVASIAGCTSARVRRIGHFDGDGNRIVLFAVETAAGATRP